MMPFWLCHQVINFKSKYDIMTSLTLPKYDIFMTSVTLPKYDIFMTLVKAKAY